MLPLSPAVAAAIQRIREDVGVSLRELEVLKVNRVGDALVIITLPDGTGMLLKILSENLDPETPTVN